MNSSDEILKKTIAWAENEKSVRGVILVGSRAIEQSDDLSDFDISIITTNTKQFTEDDSWISAIAPVWLYSPDKYTWNDTEVPTRLVLYEGGVKVDFSLWNISIAEVVGQSTFFDTGFKVLVDKDRILENFKPASLKQVTPQKPSEEEFIHIIKEFWFEAYHVAKYLKREDLWLVKFRDWSLQVYLLTIMEWYMLAKNNWNYDVQWTGKHIKKWLDPEIYQRLYAIFGHFDTEDSWKAFEARINLFRDLSKKTAAQLGYKYPNDIDENLTKYIVSLKEKSGI